jgi:hypothetical protein
MEGTGKPRGSDALRGIIHCPLCGRELEKSARRDGGWQCRCGEFVPEGLSLDSFQGCTHGLNCNCGRQGKR